MGRPQEDISNASSGHIISSSQGNIYSIKKEGAIHVHYKKINKNKVLLISRRFINYGKAS